MMTLETKIVIFCMLLLEPGITSAFRTAKCDHVQLTKALRQLRKCFPEDGNNNDLCSPFHKAENCVKYNLEDCME